MVMQSICPMCWQSRTLVEEPRTHRLLCHGCSKHVQIALNFLEATADQVRPGRPEEPREEPRGET